MRAITDFSKTNNSRVYRQLRRLMIGKKTKKCSYCRPHSGENLDYRKHGKRKPKYKNKHASVT